MQRLHNATSESSFRPSGLMVHHASDAILSRTAVSRDSKLSSACEAHRGRPACRYQATASPCILDSNPFERRLLRGAPSVVAGRGIVTVPSKKVRHIKDAVKAASVTL